MAFCVECGTKLPEGARFCSNCGKAVAQLTPAVETPVEETVVVEETPVAEVSAVEEVPAVEEVAVVEETPVVETPVTEESVVSEENLINENVYAGVIEPVPVAETIPAEESVSAETPVAAETPAAEETPVAEETPAKEVAQTEVLVSSVEAPAAEEVQPSISAEAPAAVSVVPVSTQQTDYAPSGSKEAQQALLDNIYLRLKHERLCWKIFGFVWLGYAALFTIIGFFAPVVFLYVALMYVPLGIINFKMIGKVDYYMNTLYTDCEPVVKRCSSVGMIVFGALFNTVAMIFIIINFVNVKSNADTLREIKYNQDTYNNRI